LVEEQNLKRIKLRSNKNAILSQIQKIYKKTNGVNLEIFQSKSSSFSLNNTPRNELPLIGTDRKYQFLKTDHNLISKSKY